RRRGYSHRGASRGAFALECATWAARERCVRPRMRRLAAAGPGPNPLLTDLKTATEAGRLRYTDMRRFAIALVALTASTSQSPAQPATTASTSRTASPARAASPAPGQVARVDFSCKLPIYSPDRQGAFVSFPQATVTVDPKGKHGLFYTLAYTRWMPVTRKAVSADGRRYALIEETSIRIVDVSTGAEQSFPLPKAPGPGSFAVIDFATEGVYLGLGSEGLTGLWRMDPNTGAVTRVAQLSGFQVHGIEREFWVGSTDPADPNPAQGLGGPQPDRVERLDLSDGYRETWLYRPGADVWVAAVDRQDHPIAFAVKGNSAEALLLLEPKRQLSLFKD